MNRINIGILTIPIIETGTTPLSNLIDVLKPYSNDLYLITGNDGYEHFRKDRDLHVYGIKYKASEKLILRIFKNIYMQIIIAYNLARISNKVLLWFFFIGGETLFLPALTARILGKKIVLISSGSPLKCSKFKENDLSKPIEILEYFTRYLSTYLIFYSANIVRELRLEHFSNKIIIARNHFIDFNRFNMQTKLSSRKNIIGYIGSLNEEKGILEFIEAIPKISNKICDTEILIGGDGRLKSEAEKRLNNKCLGLTIKFLGWIPHNEVPQCLNKLKLLVIPSYTEGLPNIMLEAMACGTPVLITPVGAVPDIIEDGENGFLMETNSPECISINIIRALEHPLLEYIALQARDTIERDFAYENVKGIWRKTLEAIILNLS